MSGFVLQERGIPAPILVVSQTLNRGGQSGDGTGSTDLLNYQQLIIAWEMIVDENTSKNPKYGCLAP